MIRVTVTLLSAIHSSRDRELARMDICNDGEVTVENQNLGTYNGMTYIGRDKERLDKGTPSKAGRVERWRRNDFHVWNLVRQMLQNMGYDKS